MFSVDRQRIAVYAFLALLKRARLETERSAGLLRRNLLYRKAIASTPHSLRYKVRAVRPWPPHFSSRPCHKALRQREKGRTPLRSESFGIAASAYRFFKGGPGRGTAPCAGREGLPGLNLAKGATLSLWQWECSDAPSCFSHLCYKTHFHAPYGPDMPFQ